MDRKRRKILEGKAPIFERITIPHLYPVFEGLIETKVNAPFHHPLTELPKRLHEALRAHVNDAIPLRVLLLPEMRPIERPAIVDHIASKLMDVGIDQDLLDTMTNAIFKLGKVHRQPQSQGPGSASSSNESLADRTDDDLLREKDARADTWGAICHFLFDKYARYAILSHRWLPNGEIKYQDTLKQDWKATLEGPGLDKLKGFCDVTYRKHNVTLAWVDTLCINKESSAELDEAVQSMYNWYKNSSICIAYLSDTTSLHGVQFDEWFKRGWTLQELIAPQRMQFYTRDWTRLTREDASDGIDANANDKTNPQIQWIISGVTGIGASELVSFDPLKGSDVPTRMRWAASRTTTRGEDRAYSLMGIFGVNFQTSYGEGAERAFSRLIQAIISSRGTSTVIQVLHWAGKAVSGTIHTSRLIPSNPECYRSEVSQPTELDNTDTHTSPFLAPTLRVPMTLTHIGLRIKLLLIQIEDVHIYGKLKHERHASFNPRIKLTFFPQSPWFECSDILLERRFPYIPNKRNFLELYSPQMRGEASFFLGIYTFKEDAEGDCVYLPLSACAFLLVIRTPYPGFTIDRVSSEHFGPSSKLDTQELIELKRDVDVSRLSDDKRHRRVLEYGFETLKKNFLGTKKMKVVDTYL